VSREIISTRFHRGLIAALAGVVARIAEDTGIRKVCFSGGCFLNQSLQLGLDRELKKRSFETYRHSQVPCGDGGLSLGQARIAAHNRGESQVSSELKGNQNEFSKPKP
jgi:hydrogenase maturation protein HypF